MNDTDVRNIIMWKEEKREEGKKRGERREEGEEERGGEGRGEERGEGGEERRGGRGGRRAMTNIPLIPDTSPDRQSSSRGCLAGPLNLNVGVGGLSDEEEVAAVLTHHCREHRPRNGHLLGSVGRRP